jgi:hypothetical protein
MDTSSNDSVQSDDKVSVRQGSGLKLHIKIGSDKERTSGKKDETEKKRASTVKRPPSKFRSTGYYCSYINDLWMYMVLQVSNSALFGVIT